MTQKKTNIERRHRQVHKEHRKRDDNMRRTQRVKLLSNTPDDLRSKTHI